MLAQLQILTQILNGGHAARVRVTREQGIAQRVFVHAESLLAGDARKRLGQHISLARGEVLQRAPLQQLGEIEIQPAQPPAEALGQPFAPVLEGIAAQGAPKPETAQHDDRNIDKAQQQFWEQVQVGPPPKHVESIDGQERRDGEGAVQ